MNQPKVSVLMSVYNGGRYLHTAVEGILNQKFSDFEFIIVDDASEDKTWQILSSYAEQDFRIRLIRNKDNLGLTRSLNKGLAVARGEYIARNDADDVSLPDRLAVQVCFLDNHPEVVLLGSAVRGMDESGELMGDIVRHPCTDEGVRWKMLLHNAFWHSTVMLRKETLFKHSLYYNPNLNYAQDYDLWSHMLTRGRVANLPSGLVKLRSHRQRITITKWDAQQAAADDVATANFERAGLARHFSKTEIVLMRDLAASLESRQRLIQVRSLLKLFRMSNGMMEKPDPDWRREQRTMWRQIRYHLTLCPTDMATLKTQLLVMWADPLGAAVGVLRLVKGLGITAGALVGKRGNKCGKG